MMNAFLKAIRNILCIVTAISASVCLLLAQASLDVNKTVLEPGFHKQLFVKYDMYAVVYELLSSSVSGIAGSLKNASSQNPGQENDIFLALEKSVTPEMVKLNLDSSTEGIFQYIKGERSFLPDIYLNMQATEAGGIQTPAGTLAKIDKINSSTILLYVNRYDIIDGISILKLFYYLMGKLPRGSLLAFLFLLLAGLILCQKPGDILRWLKVTLLSYASLGLVGSIGLLVFNYVILPGKISGASFFSSRQTEAILSYLRGCTGHLTVFLLVSAAVAAALSLLLFIVPRWIPGTFLQEPACGTEKKRDTLRNAFYILLIILSLFASAYKLQAFKEDFSSNDFTAVLSKMMNARTVTQVVSAMDDTIYALQVRLVDRKTDKPVKNIQVGITGKYNTLERTYNSSALTDEAGVAKFNLDKGNFRLSFSSDGKPPAYQMPDPFFINLKSVGTTIITVQLDPAPDTEMQKYGVSEIEVLGPDNQPIPGLQLSIQGGQTLPGNLHEMFSYTNTEGIAVFKLMPGNYSISFSQAGFPARYSLPSSMDIAAKAGSTTRYTVRLVDTK